MQNRLRQQLQRKETTYGIWVTVESPTVTEVAAAMGLDWVCIDMEHGHQDFREVIDHLRAVRGSETCLLARVPDFQWSYIKRALDMGAHGVIVPYVQTAEDVETAIRYGKYPPRGVRGVGGDRCVHWGLGFQEYLTTADAETLIIPIIETRAAYENIDSILEVPDLEALFFGPADFSASHGYLGEWEGPGMAERILEVKAKAEAKGIATGISARNIPDSLHRRDQGFHLINLGADMSLLIRALKENLAALGQDVTPKLLF